MTVKIDRAYPLKDHRVGLKEHSYQGVIKVGDTITTSNGREGKIKTITIATHENDVAGESGTDVLSYNTKWNIKEMFRMVMVTGHTSTQY